jgi:hypothetical protein
MTSDPAGYYAALEVEPDAPAEAIAAAFRRKARVLHPDVTGTGDAEAFMRVRVAYDTLGDAGRRSAYDRAARAAVSAETPTAVAEPMPRGRGPRLTDLPVPLWAGLGGVFCVAALMAVVQFGRPAPHAAGPAVQPVAPGVPSDRSPPPPVAVAATTGPTTHYVLPASREATLWRHDPVHDTFLPAGHVAAFSPLEALSLVPQHGLVEIRLADGGSGFVDASRLTPGDRAAARRAYCAYAAGPAPQNGEVFSREGDGAARFEISNRAAQPVVVKLRNAAGRTAATVFVAPGGTAVVGNLPDAAYRPDFAIGELWSRVCNSFAAGMRAERFAVYILPSGQLPLLIPPDLSVLPAPKDIPDEAFEQE